MTTVDDYLAAQPEPARKTLRKVRAAIRKALPAATEEIAYKMPTYKVGGKAVLHFAGYAKHWSLFPASARVLEELGDELGERVEHVTIRFGLDEAPAGLIARIAKLRVEEVAGERDGALADRIRRAVGPRADVTEKKMFGGIAFLLDGKMFLGIAKGDLMVRVGPDQHDAALAERHVRPMDFTGRPLRGYVYVDPAGFATPKALAKWVDRALTFVATVERGARKKRAKAGARTRRS